MSAIFDFKFLTSGLDITIFGLTLEADFTIFEVYAFDNVLTYFQKTRTVCDKLSWYYDVLQLSTTVSATFDECILGVYDYHNGDIDTCAGNTYSLEDFYDYSFSDRSGEGWYGINTCDKDTEPTTPPVDPTTPTTDETSTTTDETATTTDTPTA